MPKGKRRHVQQWKYKDAEQHAKEERQASAARVVLVRPLRLMTEFSAAELDALQAKLERWVREGTCRVSARPSM
jgi:hypothetical protein